MGKGARAAALAALAIGALRAARRRSADLPACVAEIHEALFAFDPDSFLTLFAGRWHAPSGTLEWVDAGHLPPLLMRGGRVRELEGASTYPLGVLHARREFTVNTVTLRAGDRLLAFSDGIVERRLPDGRRFGTDRLAALLRETAGLPPVTAVATIERAVLGAAPDPVHDDATQLLLDLSTPPPTGPAAPD